MLLADWRTLARIIRRSTAVLEVLDARDPQGTRSPRAEHMTKAMEKKLILVINKDAFVYCSRCRTQKR